jgi:hypothetical protein
MEIELVVLKLIEHLDEGHSKDREGKCENLLAILIAIYFFKAKFNFPLRLWESAASRRKSKDCISCRSAAGLGASFCCRGRVRRKNLTREKTTADLGKEAKDGHRFIHHASP